MRKWCLMRYFHSININPTLVFHLVFFPSIKHLKFEKSAKVWLNLKNISKTIFCMCIGLPISWPRNKHLSIDNNFCEHQATELLFYHIFLILIGLYGKKKPIEENNTRFVFVKSKYTDYYHFRYCFIWSHKI